MPRTPTVLLLSADPMAAALLGLLAESAGYRPAFPACDEAPEAAVARVRPLFVVLIDGSLDAVRSDLFFGRAALRRVGLAVLLPPGRSSTLAQWANDRAVPCFDVPTDREQFARMVDVAHASNWWRSGRDRRRVPQTEHTSDGALVYIDRTGRRWQVFDRRGPDRRQKAEVEGDAEAGAGAMDDGARPPRSVGSAKLQPKITDLDQPMSPSQRVPSTEQSGAVRVFVGDSGDAWQCALGDTDGFETAPLVLERQLARAVRVSFAGTP